MKISKLFHWLYAILMLMPFLALAFNFVRLSLSSGVTIVGFDDVSHLISVPTFDGLSYNILHVYEYLVETIFGVEAYSWGPNICRLLTYWTIISIVYLIFDVLMYVPLLVHRWIDKARVE